MTRVYVGNLEDGCSKRELEREMEGFGRLRDVWVARNPPGFAFVVFEDRRDAEDAVRHLNGRRLCGCRVRVEVARGPSRGGRAARLGLTEKCYECGRVGHYARDCTRRPGSNRSERSRSQSPKRRHSRSRSYSPRKRRSRSASRSESKEKKGRKSRDSRSRSGSKEAKSDSEEKATRRRSSEKNDDDDDSEKEQSKRSGDEAEDDGKASDENGNEDDIDSKENDTKVDEKSE